MRTSALAMIVVGLGCITSALAQDVPFRAPEGSSRARRTGDQIVDCAAHGAWSAPEGWTVSRTREGDVVAIEPSGRAVLVRAQTRTRTTHVRSTPDFRRIADEVARRWAPDAALLEPTEHARSRWHIDRRIEGTATVSGVSMRVVAESRGERQLWVALSPDGDAALSAAIDAAMASYLPLTSHACLCEYDCDARPRP